MPVPGDYDGDGKMDIVDFRPSIGAWFMRLSSTGFVGSLTYNWGLNGDSAVLGRQ